MYGGSDVSRLLTIDLKAPRSPFATTLTQQALLRTSFDKQTRSPEATVRYR